jgi:hypothetical protein
VAARPSRVGAVLADPARARDDRRRLGYPIYRLVQLSTQHYGLFELIQHKGKPAGLSNYGSILQRLAP